jgi:hypothetical protein
MTCKTGLPTDQNPLTDLSAATNAGLGCNDGKIAHFDIMCDLDEVVQLGATFNKRRAHRGPVDRSIGAYLHIVFNDHIADLRDLFQGSICLRSKTKSIAADNGTGMNRNIITQLAVMIDLYPRVDDAVVADDNIIADICIGIDLGIVSQFYMFTDISKGADKNLFAIGSGLGYITGFLYAC